MGREGGRPKGRSGGVRPTRPEDSRVGPNVPRGDNRSTRRPGDIPKRRPEGLGDRERLNDSRGSERVKMSNSRVAGKGDVPWGGVKRPGNHVPTPKSNVKPKRPDTPGGSSSRFRDGRPRLSPEASRAGEFSNGRPRPFRDDIGREDKEESYIYEEDNFGDDTIQLDSEDVELLGEVEDFLGDSAYEDILGDDYYGDELGDDLTGEDYYFEDDYDEDYEEYDEYFDDEYDGEYDEYYDDEYDEYSDEDEYSDDDDYYDDGDFTGSGGRLTENPWFVVVLTLGIIVILVVTFNIGKSRGYKKGKQEAELQYMLDKKESAGEVKDVEDELDVDKDNEDNTVDNTEDTSEAIDNSSSVGDVAGDLVDDVVEDVKDEVKEKVDSEVDKAIDEGTKVVDDVATGAVTVVKETIDLSKFEDDVEYKLGDIVDNKGTIVQALSVDELLEHESVELKKDKFIEVGVLLQNSTDGVLKYGLDQFKIVDGDGKTHKPSNKFIDLEGYLGNSLEVEPGMELRGKIVFDVSDDVDTYTLVAKSKAGLVFDNVKIALR